MPSKFVPVDVYAKGSFFFMAEKDSVVQMYHISFIHESVDTYLDCSRILTVAVSVSLFRLMLVLLLDIDPGAELLDHMVVLFLVFDSKNFYLSF